MTEVVEDALGMADDPNDETARESPHTRLRVMEELLKQKQSEAAGLLATYLRAYAIFLAITGGMLKFALDANATHELRQALCLLGFASCVCAFLAGVFGELLRRDTRARLSELLGGLYVRIEADDLRGLMYTTITGVLFSVFIFIGWVYIFMH
jgi:hypothetical protein